MKSFSKTFSIVFALIFVSNFYLALGQVAIITNKKNHKYGGNTIVFGNGGGCPPGLVKDGGKKGNTVVAVPNCKPPPKPKPKIEFVPYPVKEYVAVPYIKEKPIIVEVVKKEIHLPMKHPMVDMDHMYGMDMGMGFGLDSKKSVTHVSANKSDKQKKKVIKTSRQRSESRPQKRSEETTKTPKN